MWRCGVATTIRRRDRRRRAVVIATVRMILTAAVLVAIDRVVPDDFTDTNASTFVRLMVGVVVFAGLMLLAAA